jgi:ADP-ribosylglycohydrolase
VSDKEHASLKAERDRRLADSVIRDRAYGTLAGLAVGDALGMPTQMLPRREVERLFPTLTWFQDGPPENLISPGRPAGEVTDDTQQALMLADLLIDGGGRIDQHKFIARLAAWAAAAEQNGTEQLGPSSRRALEEIASGVGIDQAGRYGATNGAAMRIAPVGIITLADDPTMLVDRVEEVCSPTHHTGLAIAGAAAVAAAISARLDGLGFGEALSMAVDAAELGSTRGYHVNGAEVSERITWAVGLVKDLDDADLVDRVSRLVGAGVQTQETVPAAFALASRWPGDPWSACLAAAQLGGDTDTVAAITGAMVAAGTGVGAFPPGALGLIEDVNNLGLAEIAHALLRLRPPKTRE